MDFMKHGGKNMSWTAMITCFAIFLLTYFAKLYWFYWIVDLTLIAGALLFHNKFALNMNRISRNFYDKVRAVG